MTGELACLLLKRFSLAILLLAGGLSGWSGELGAGDAAHFLRLGLGARARGMGGAFVAVADDATACYWNPAGLSLISGFRLGGAYENRFGGLVTTQYLVGAYCEKVFGTGFLWFNSEPYSVYFVSASRRWDDLSFGISGKVYNFASRLQSANGFGFDLGTILRVPLEGMDLTLGLVSRDIGWSVIRWHGVGVPAVDHVAWVTRLGMALGGEVDFGIWLWATDLEIALRRPPHQEEENYLSRALELSASMGGELCLGDITLRAGLCDIRLQGGVPTAKFTFGAGVCYQEVGVQMAWILTSFGPTYVLSAEFAF